MTLHIALSISALVAAALLLVFSQQRAWASIAAVAAALEVAMAFGLLRMTLSGVPLGLVLGLGLALPGLAAWFRATAKPAVSAAAIVAFTGIVQVAVYATARL